MNNNNNKFICHGSKSFTHTRARIMCTTYVQYFDFFYQSIMCTCGHLHENPVCVGLVWNNYLNCIEKVSLPSFWSKTTA